MRISDWSSDVCSSDLSAELIEPRRGIAENHSGLRFGGGIDDLSHGARRIAERPFAMRIVLRPHHAIGADVLQQLQTDGVGLESRVHVVPPIVAWPMLRDDVVDAAMRTVCQLRVLQRTRHPVDAAFGARKSVGTGKGVSVRLGPGG